RDEGRRCVASRRESSLCRLATRVVVVSRALLWARGALGREVFTRLERSEQSSSSVAAPNKPTQGSQWHQEQIGAAKWNRFDVLPHDAGAAPSEDQL
ncbi:MAG: hypothetical protein ACM3ZE_07010, partial [Myxococcales bacterium]